MNRGFVYGAVTAMFLMGCGGKPEICAPLIDCLAPCCPPDKKTRGKENAHA